MQSETADDLAMATATAAQPGRALVLLAGAGAAPAPVSVRPRAAFLAHLIATARRLPQTRERRRGSVGDALALYRSGDACPRPGTPVSRSV